jgi:hypothetical protein
MTTVTMTMWAAILRRSEGPMRVGVARSPASASRAIASRAIASR